MSKIQRPNIKDVCTYFELRAPSSAAEKWDNVGLISGDKMENYRGGIVAIDLTEEAVDLAIAERANLIVNHHPAIFPRGKGLNSFSAEGRSSLLYRTQKAGISVLSSHTNFDRCALEAMEWLSSALGTTPIGRLHGDEDSPLRKLVVYAPKKSREKVSAALFAAGAGHNSEYDRCSFTAAGEGTFRGSSRTNPTIGVPGKLERVAEVRIETIFPETLKREVLRALREAHPYEAIAYDLYRVEQKPGNKGFVRGLGYGFIGEFPSSVSFADLMNRVYDVFQVSAVMASTPHPKSVRKIAFSPGKGSSFIHAAQEAGCDVFITGETGYHDSREAAALGLQVLEVGHRESEIAFLNTAEKWLKSFKMGVKVLNSPVQHILQDGRSLESIRRFGRKVRAP